MANPCTSGEFATLPSSAEARSRIRELRKLAKSEALAAFEGALDLLGRLSRAAAQRDVTEDGGRSSVLSQVRLLVKLVGRLLDEDARKQAHEIDRETGWFALFETWLDDDAGLLDDFEGFLARMAALESDRRLLVRLASDELADLPIVFPVKDDADARRAVIKASRFRLESLISALLALDGRHAYPLAIAEAHQRETGDSTALVEALLRSRDSGAAVAAAQRALEDPREIHPARIHALLGEALTQRGTGRALRQHLETAFLRHPSEKAFQAVKHAVSGDQWPQVRSRILGHLQKHQREPTLVFKLYWNEGLLVDADGLVVTQPVDPDLLARAAMKLTPHDPVVAAGWLLIAAYRLADSNAKARWPDVIRHLVLVRDLTARCNQDGEFSRVLRTFRFRHAHSPDLLSRLADAGL